jgi:hypothetical protein
LYTPPPPRHPTLSANILFNDDIHLAILLNYLLPRKAKLLIPVPFKFKVNSYYLFLIATKRQRFFLPEEINGTDPVVGPEAVLAAGTGNDAMLLQSQEYKIAALCRNTMKEFLDICTKIGLVVNLFEYTPAD